MSVMLGAWVSRARLQAAEGIPIPTKHTSSSFSARAAVIIIISDAVWSTRYPLTLTLSP